MKSALHTYIIISAIAILVTACSHRASDYSPQPQAESMIVASDLSNQRIMAFAEDSAGHVWIGTFRGLNRYNGHDYHQYYCTDSIIDLPDNQIHDLYYDSRNRLWVATLNGVAIYDNNNHFHQIKPSQGGAQHAQQIIESEGLDKRIYINYKNHLDVYDEEKQQLVTVIPDLCPEYSYSLSCHFDRRNKLWILTQTTLRCLQPDTYQVIDSITLPAIVNTHYMDKDNDCIWLGGDRYLAAYDLRNHEMRQLPKELTGNPLVAEANITDIHPYEGGYLLLNTSNRGVIVYHSISGRVWGEGQTGYPFDLPPFRISGFYTDSHKNLWVGSYDHGASVINKYKRQFNSNTALQTFVNERAIHSLDCDADGNLWMAAGFDGVLVYNTNTGDAHQIDAHMLSGSNAPNASILLIKATSDGSIWLGSLLEGRLWRCKWDGSQLQVAKEYPMLAPLLISEDSDNRLWIGTGSPWLISYNPATDTFVGTEVPMGSEADCMVSGLAPAHDRVYVSAFMRPLMQATATDTKIDIDTLDLPTLKPLISSRGMIPTDMLFDSYGILWIGTVGNGLLRYDPEGGALEQVADVPCTDIAALEEDRQGHIWISTQYGLARYDRTTGKTKCYYANDGIGGNQFFDRCSTILPNGTLVFGGTHGITEFNPINIGNKRKVPLVFEDLKIHNNIVDPLASPEIISSNLNSCQQVTLGDDENAFSISFAALDYASDEAPNYSYLLEGHDPYWIDARHSNEAYYAKVRPGKYTFRVRIADGSNSLVESEIAVPIKVKGSLWLSWWAILAYITVICVIAGVVLWHRYVIRTQQMHMQQMLVALESMNAQPATSTPAPPDDAPSEAEKETDKEAEKEAEKKSDSTAPQQLSDSDVKFLQELHQLMEDELSNPELDVNRLTEMMRISRTKFYYKVKALTGENPSVFFKTYKLNRAAQLLKDGHHTVTEVAEMTGFSSAAHFSTSFKKHFGKTPTVYSK